MSDERPDSPEWLASRFHGDAGEMALAKWFRRRGCDVSKVLEPASDYDLLVLSRIEVKRDVAALTTGNVAIETSYAGRPSGITSTRSTMWAFIVGQEAIMVPTARLRDWLAARNFPERPAGDGHKARILLVPLVDLRAQPFVRVVRLDGER